MKEYNKPEIIIFKLYDNDIVRTSGAIELPGDDFNIVPKP